MMDHNDPASLIFLFQVAAVAFVLVALVLGFAGRDRR